MDEHIIDELRARAAADAQAFRQKFGRDEQPNEKWLDNSFTAAVPLVTRAAELPPVSAKPHLFDIYKQEVMRTLGISGPPRQDSEDDRKKQPGSLVQQPTPGED